MRTIKFRGKKIENNEWLYGDLMQDDRGDYYIFPNDCGGLYAKNKVETNTIGQFTGLFDKNGKEIYEGDIVKFTKWNGELEIGLVKCDDCNPCMCIEYNTEYKQKNWEFDFIKCGTMKIEVIGNIHDNPELMKGE